jgi:hypothetical protein
MNGVALVAATLALVGRNALALLLTAAPVCGDLPVPFSTGPRSGSAVEPRLEQLLDLAAPAGAFEPPQNTTALAHDQSRHLRDRVAFDVLGMFVAVDPL